MIDPVALAGRQIQEASILVILCKLQLVPLKFSHWALPTKISATLTAMRPLVHVGCTCLEACGCSIIEGQLK